MKPRILLVDDDPAFVEDILHHLGSRFEWNTLSNGERVLEVITESLPDVVLLDIELGAGPDGFEILGKIRSEVPSTPVVMVTHHDPSRMAAQAWRLGAFGYIEKGERIDHLAAHIERAIEEATLHREREALRQEIAQRSGQLVGRSPAMMDLMKKISQVAKTSSTVLITGETGTGKEVVARQIHSQSSRSQRLLVPVECPGIQETLVESELFGHEKGAFTGAIRRRIGYFETAQRGTIFLDEISEINTSVQAKLLRVLQDRQIQRVGSSELVPIDVRIIAASNRDLEAMVDEGSFRRDLYYRLRVVPLHIPPLRERKDDIPILAQHLLDRKAGQMARHRSKLSSEALDRLLAWHWPGNVRELENVLENALVHSQSDVLGEDLFVGLVGGDMSRLNYKEAQALMLDKFDRDYVNLMLNESAWNVSKAARRMGLTRQGLEKKMKKLAIKRPTDARDQI